MSQLDADQQPPTGSSNFRGTGGPPTPIPHHVPETSSTPDLPLGEGEAHGIVLEHAVSNPTACIRKPLTARILLDSGLVGIWADRTEMKSSQEFARDLRCQGETRHQG